MSVNIILISILLICCFCCISSSLSAGYALYINAQPTPTPSPSSSNLLMLNCKADISECENQLQKDNFIKIISGPLARISYSLETKPDGTIERDYYFYMPYDFIISFLIDLQAGNININSLGELEAKFNVIDQQFTRPRDTPIVYDNILKKVRNASEAPYNTTVFFYNVFNIAVVSDLINKSILPKINSTILNQYYIKIQTKLNESNSITLFEYIMYITIYNYLNNKNLKYVILKK
jgi:hypothetical protein